RGARSYTANRGLAAYAEVLPGNFCAALGRLGSADRWLDIGAGEGQAILEYYAPGDAAAAKCAGAGSKARAVAISIEDRRTDQWQQQAASLGAERIQYLAGKRLSQYSSEALGKFQLITDVYGGFTYTENLSRFVKRFWGCSRSAAPFTRCWRRCTWTTARISSAPGTKPSWWTARAVRSRCAPGSGRPPAQKPPAHRRSAGTSPRN